jgi:hypothetical protein
MSTSSCSARGLSAPAFSTPAAHAFPKLRRPVVRPLRRGGATGAAPVALAGLILFLALLVAPEQPGLQAAICHRHIGVEACRVW